MENDIVMFKLRESELSTVWVMGIIEQVRKGRDGLARECTIAYKSVGSSDQDLCVERPVREIVKLFHIEDTSLLQDIENARKIAVDALKEKNMIVNEENSRSIVGSHEKVAIKSELHEVPEMSLIKNDFHEQMDQMNMLGGHGQYVVASCAEVGEGQLGKIGHYWRTVNDYKQEVDAYVHYYKEYVEFEKESAVNKSVSQMMDIKFDNDDPVILF